MSRGGKKKAFAVFENKGKHSGGKMKEVWGLTSFPPASWVSDKGLPVVHSLKINQGANYSGSTIGGKEGTRGRSFVKCRGARPATDVQQTLPKFGSVQTMPLIWQLGGKGKYPEGK